MYGYCREKLDATHLGVKGLTKVTLAKSFTQKLRWLKVYSKVTLAKSFTQKLRWLKMFYSKVTLAKSFTQKLP